MGEGVAPQFVLVAEAPAALEALVRPEVAQSNVVVAGHPGGESGRAMFAGKYLKGEEFCLISQISLRLLNLQIRKMLSKIRLFRIGKFSPFLPL